MEGALMKKIGIITLYHNNSNYGGLLQAYALQKVVEKLEFDVEQICTNFIDDSDKKLMPKRSGIKGLIRNILNQFIYYKHSSDFKIRKEAFKKFEKNIPHSSEVYSHDTIDKSNEIYDHFITGSDQVWNLSWFQPEYFLSFVDKEKKKISYAASMPDSSLTNEQKRLIKNYIKSFSAISVREDTTVELFDKQLNVHAEKVVDPTLLLDKEEWNRIEENCEILNRYIFCYFLSGKKSIRKMAEKIAKDMKLKIVTLPHIGSINISDCLFGDYKLYNVTPGQFIHLIKNAEYVLTDSFHATVFSNIYKKKYLVLPRVGQEEMNTRILSLLELFGEKERFITTYDDTKSLYSLIEKEVVYDDSSYNMQAEKSKKFLYDYLVEE